MHGLIDFIFGAMTKDINCFNWQFLSYHDWKVIGFPLVGSHYFLSWLALILWQAASLS